MNKQLHKWTLSCTLLLILVLSGCSKDETTENAPVFTISEAVDITRTTAKLKGEIYASDGQNFECGFLYATVSTVPTKDAIKVRGNIIDTYACEATLTGLKPNTTYYYCMYASNGVNIVRSQEIKHFSTKEDGSPMLNNVTIVSVGERSLTVSSNIIDEGGSELRQYGFAYKTVNDVKFSYVYATEFINEKTKTYQLTIDKLEPETTYIIKATASNSKGEGSGPEATQATKSLESPTVTTQDVTNITATSCVATGIIEDPGKGELLERGFMIVEKGSTDTPRKIEAPMSTTDNTFVTTISELKANTTYTIYAYAKSLLTAQTLIGQGSVKEFKTLELTTAQISAPAYKDINSQSNSMTVTAHISDFGNGHIRSCGFYYSTSNKNPTSSDSQLECTLINNNIISGTISGLQKNKTYYVRAYAFNESGIGLSNVSECMPFPVSSLILGNVGYSMDGDKMTLTSSITSTGGGTVSERGFMWSTTSSNSAEMTKVIATGDDRLFTATLTSIKKDTHYYIRAYAINENGITYGEPRDFTPIQVEYPTLGNVIWSLNNTTLILKSKVTSVGYGTIVERGFKWSKLTNDPSKMQRLSASSGTDAEFSSNLTEIEANQLYHICAYATNEKGTAYSTVISITPLKVELPTVGRTQWSMNGKSIVLNSTALSGYNLTKVGFYYSTTNSISTDSEFLSATPGETFKATLSNLEVNTTYYVRAYAENIGGGAWGEMLTIDKPLKTPNFSEPYFSNITGKSIEVYSSMWTANGTISAKGFCYSSTNENPTLADSHIECTGSDFSTVLTGLEFNKTYYIRAYAINENGIGYSIVKAQKTKGMPSGGDIESPDKNN